MLKKFFLQQEEDLPGIVLDAANNEFVIYGRVLPEDGHKFFTPVLKWVKQYIREANPYTEFHFRLDYYNSSTARMITKIIVELEKVQEFGKEVKVVWEYYKKDEIMQERGEELKSISYLPFELKPIPHKIV